MNDSTRFTRRDAGAVRSTPRPEPVVAAPPMTPAASSHRRWLLGVAVLVLAGVVWDLSLRVPCGPSAGTLDVKILASSVAPTEAAKFRLGTYNIHGGVGLDGDRNLDRIADVISGLDFIGLNEVHGPGLWEREDQATQLGRSLRLTPLYAPTEERWRHLRFGNGLLTRLDVEHWQVVPLERRYGKSFRNLVHVRARAPNGVPVNIVLTHIDRSDDRERHEQLRTAANYFLSLAEPAVLMGDLNSDASEREVQRLLDEPRVVDVMSQKFGFQTPRHIDWVFVRGLEVVDAGLINPGPSDHGHIWAEVKVPAAEEREPGRVGDGE